MQPWTCVGSASGAASCATARRARSATRSPSSRSWATRRRGSPTSAATCSARSRDLLDAHDHVGGRDRHPQPLDAQRRGGGRGLRRARGRLRRPHAPRHRREPPPAHRQQPPGRVHQAAGQDAARTSTSSTPSSPTVPPDRRVLAALGPKMLGLARDRAGGAHPYLVTPEHTAVARAELGDGPLLAPEQHVVLETDAGQGPRGRPRGPDRVPPAPELREQLAPARVHRGRLRRRRQRPARRPRRGVGRRGHHRGPGAGPLRRRRRPRLRAGVHRCRAHRRPPGRMAGARTGPGGSTRR